ncbi:hypothetical protein NPIL_190971, partial [Nephila pilipes]
MNNSVFACSIPMAETLLGVLSWPVTHRIYTAVNMDMALEAIFQIAFNPISPNSTRHIPAFWISLLDLVTQDSETMEAFSWRKEEAQAFVT